MNQKIGIFRFSLHRAVRHGRRWATLAYHWATLDTGRPYRWRRYTAVPAQQRGSVHALTGQQDSMGGLNMEQGLNCRYNAKLDGQNG